MSLMTKEIFEFGDFRLDVSERTIERVDGARNGTLTEKSFQALVLLVRRRGHLVPKDDLIRFIWPDTIVEDNNLEKCIHHLRHFLGETADRSGYIETVRKYGYRFVGDVKAIEVSGSWIPESFRTAGGYRTDLGTSLPTDIHPKLESISETRAETTSRSEEISRSLRGRIALMVGIILLSTAAITWLGYYISTRSATLDDARKSIAVLPLRPVDPANRSDIQEIGIADALIHRLSAKKDLVVRPLSATRKYTDIDDDPLVAGYEQKVDYIVASNYQIADGRIKVTSQLFDVATGSVEDTFAVEKDSLNLFAAQDAIASDISSQLLSRFGSAPIEARSKRGTENEAAYRFYLLAMNLSEERGEQNVKKSMEYLDRAVVLDPDYALAWAAKARTHGDIVALTDSGQHENFRSAQQAIDIALSIDPNLSDAYSALCHKRNRYEWDPVAAEIACRRAIELDPNSPIAHKTFANFLYSRGRFDESIREIQTAMDLQPVSYRNQQMYGLSLYYAQRYDEAEAHFKHLIELNPNHTHIHGRLIKVLEEVGKETEAFEYLIKKLLIEKRDAEVQRYESAYRTSGWKGVRAEAIRIAEAKVPRGNFQLACIYAKLGNKDKAFENLETAYHERGFQIAVLQVEPQLRLLHDDPRYADLVRRIEGK